jgi:hypothetical protein
MRRGASWHYSARRDDIRRRPSVPNRPAMHITVLILCLLLCAVNAVLWTFYSEMPIAGMLWIAAAAVSIWLRKWSITPPMKSRPKKG